MADNTLPPLPPGFELVGDDDQQQAQPMQPMQAAQDMPPLPPGFELISDEPAPLEIDVIGGTPESRATPEQLAADRALDQQPKQQGNAVTRFLGEIGGRQVLQGAYGLYGSLGGDALDHYVLGPLDRAIGTEGTRFQLGTGGRGYRQMASDYADSLGMRKPQTPGERIASDVGEALTGTGLTLGIGAGANALARVGGTASSRLGNLLTTQPVLQAVSTGTGTGASSAARESGAGEGAQLAAGLIGGLAPGVAGYGTGAATRGLVRGTSGDQMRKSIADFASVGASPSVGQASGRWGVQGAENLLAGGPTSAGVMTRFAERQADDIGAGLRAEADFLSPNASAERAGRAIDNGVQTFTRNTNATKRALYWQADRFIPAQTAVPLSNTWQEVVRLTTPTPGATATTGALINPRIAQLRETIAQDVAAGGGSIPYEALKRIRTDIGEALSDFSLSPDTPTRELRRIYAALSRDMEAAAQSQGPQAVAAAKRANNYTRAVADRLETVQRVIDKNGGPEKVFEAAMSGTRDGGTTLRAVMQSLPQDGQRAVTAAVIKRMGLPTAGQASLGADQFSASTFLTNWNRLSPEARRALFDRYGPSFSKDMDRIARVADNIKQGSKVFANPSGTSNRAAATSYGLAVVGSILQAPFTGNWIAPAATIGGGIAANRLAARLTNPDFVRWLANATAYPVGSGPALVQSLRRLGEKNQDQELIDAANELENQGQNEPGNADG